MLQAGRQTPSLQSVGIATPGIGTIGITSAGQAALTRQRFTNTSLPTRLLGEVLGAAETIVPAVGSPTQTLRQMAKSARDFILNGATGAAETGYQIGSAAQAGDPHAQGASLAVLGSAGLLALGAHPTPPVEQPFVDLTPSPKPSAEPLDVPAYQRRNVPTTANFPTDQTVRLAALARRRQAELQAQGFLGTGTESMTPADVTKVKVIGAPKPKGQ